MTKPDIKSGFRYLVTKPISPDTHHTCRGFAMLG